MEFYIFLFITAVVFTFAGARMFSTRIDKKTTELAVATCIDTLINDGYLQTSGSGPDMKILKWNECKNDKTN
jgi:hypothetical protein